MSTDVQASHTQAIIVQQAVGLPQTISTTDVDDDRSNAWTSGIFKKPVMDRRWLSPENLEGDGQADLKVHGGPDKAVLIYPASHYLWWRSVLRQPDLPWGAFGENWTITGHDERTVCLGDVFAAGEALVQVSQPRRPCWKLSRRCGIPDLAVRAQKCGRLGWYVRVLQCGSVTVGDSLRLMERPLGDWPIARLNRVRQQPGLDPQAGAFLASCDLLSSSWRLEFQKSREKQPDA